MDAATLLASFLQLYPDFRSRLRRRFGSVELADEALNEVYVKLRQSAKPYDVRNIKSYLFRLALNTAVDQRRAAARLAGASEIEAAMAIADRAPGPQQIAEGRDELAVLEAAIAGLTERRRTILAAARIDGRSCREIAEEMGLSKRTVEMELRHALDHCAHHMARAQTADCSNAPATTSYH
jgi:RNA polymerase sigma factor (sigma-70 family)